MSTHSARKLPEFSSLQEALAEFQIPQENHALIRRLCNYVGVERFEKRSACIKAVRRDNGPALEIHWGWTNGFRSQAELQAAVADDASDHWPSGSRPRLWYVAHPINRLR